MRTQLTRAARFRIAGTAALLAATLAAPCPAQVQRAFVSTTGTDTNPCSHQAPCRTFGKAHSVVLTGGEILALDSGGYGPFTITKSVHLVTAPGAYVGVSVALGNGILINAPGAEVSLSNLFLNGVGGTNGIKVEAVGTLLVENCQFSNFTGRGLELVTTGNASCRVRNCVFRYCQLHLIYLEANGGQQQFLLEDSTFSDTNNSAVNLFEGFINATIRNCIFDQTGTAIYIPGTGVDALIEGCTMVNGVSAISGSGASFARVGNCYVARNSNGFTSSGGFALRSFGNNKVAGNLQNQTIPTKIPLK